MIRPDGEWCDLVARPDGTVAWIYQRGTLIECELADSGARLWALEVGRKLLFLRAAADDFGHMAAVGQGHDGQAAVIIAGRTTPVLLGGTFGTNPVEIAGLADGWRVYVQRAADAYDVVQVSPDGALVSSTTVPMAPTSQGFLDVYDWTVITQDAGRHRHGLVLPNQSPDGTVWVGQHPTEDTLAVYDQLTGQVTRLGTGVAQPPHITQDARGRYFVCAWRHDGAWVEHYERPFRDVGPTPIPTPIPNPTPGGPVDSVPNRLDAVRRARAQYPADWALAHKDYEHQDQPGRTTTEQAERFIRRLAYDLHREDPRFGLNGKRGSSTLSQDALCFRHSDGFESVIDCISGAGGADPTEAWGVVNDHLPAGSNQRWIQPQPVSGGGQPGPTPQPTPAPVPSLPPFPAFQTPEDVFLHALTRYIREGLWPRDVEGDTCSRGALMYFVPVFDKLIIEHIVSRKHQLPTPAEWWVLADRGAEAAIRYYRERQPTP